MYSPTFDKHIDIQQDKNAIVEYCSKHWIVKDNQEQFAKMVSFLFDYGMKLGTHKFNSSEFSLAAHELLKIERSLMKEKLAKGDESAMDLYYVKSDVSMPNHTLERLLKDGVGYNTYMPKLLKFVKNEFSELKTIKPLNWKKYLNDSSDFSDIEYGVNEEFNGSASSCGSGYSWQEFPDSVSLSTTQYNNERDRKPLECLVKAIVLHGYATKIHNNTVDVIAEFKQIFKDNVDEFQLNKIIPNIKNTTLKAIFELNTYDKKKHKNKAEFENSIGSSLIVEYFTPESIYNKDDNTLTSQKSLKRKM